MLTALRWAQTLGTEMNKALLREIISPQGERVRYADEKNTAVVLQVVRLSRDAKGSGRVSVCVCVCVEVSTKAASKAQLKGILKEFDREMKENVYSTCKGPETRITETGRPSS